MRCATAVVIVAVCLIHDRLFIVIDLLPFCVLFPRGAPFAAGSVNVESQPLGSDRQLLKWWQPNFVGAGCRACQSRGGSTAAEFHCGEETCVLKEEKDPLKEYIVTYHDIAGLRATNFLS